LLELMIAIVLMTIAVFAVINLQVVAIRSNGIANGLSSATALAETVLDNMMSLDVSDAKINTNATNIPANHIDPANPNATSITVPGAGTYSATYTTLVGTSANGVPSNVTKITVTATGGGHTVTICGFKRTV